MGIFSFLVACALLAISRSFGCPGSPFFSAVVNGALHYLLRGKIRILVICASLAISRVFGCPKPAVLAMAANCALRYMPRGTLRLLAICASLVFSYGSGDPLLVVIGSAAGWMLSSLIEDEGGKVWLVGAAFKIPTPPDTTLESKVRRLSQPAIDCVRVFLTEPRKGWQLPETPCTNGCIRNICAHSN